MPNKKISQFPVLTGITDNVDFPVVLSGGNYIVKFSAISDTIINDFVPSDVNVLGTRLSGFTTGLREPLSSNDTILSGFENLQVSKQDLLNVQLSGSPESLSFIEIDNDTANVNIVAISTGQTEINISTETSGVTDSIILNEDGLVIENDFNGNTTSFILSDGFGVSYTGSGIFNDSNGFYIKNSDKIYFPRSILSGDTLARLSDLTGITGNSLVYYAETNDPILILPIAQGTSSIAIGDGAAATADNMLSIGQNAGSGATLASFSTLIGHNVGMTFSGNNIGSNNIIIGNNITLPSGTTNALNIGGVLFGVNTKEPDNDTPSMTANTNGKIGVKVVNPKSTLEVGGTLGAAYTYVDMMVIGGTYTINEESSIYRFDYTGTEDYDIVLPDPSLCLHRIYYISRGSDSDSGILRILSVTGEIEDPNRSFVTEVILDASDRYQWISDGTNWVLIMSS